MKPDKPVIGLDTSPLASGHAHRGIGAYTRFLSQALSQENDISVTQIATAKDRKKHSPDLIHYPFFDLFFGTLPVVERIPRVVTIHDVIPLRYPDHYPMGIKAKLRLKKQKLALKSVNHIITDSQASKTDIVDFLDIKPEKVSVVHLAANPELKPQSNYAVTKLRRSLNIPPRYILYVGDINYNKNVPQLIKSLVHLSDDIHLVCVGRNFYPHDIPEWRAIDTQIEMSQVRSRVHFLNQILGSDIDQLATLYSGAAVYVQPSLYEGFGLPVLEAMICKSPVVSARTSSLVEVGGSVSTFAAQPDHMEFATAIAEVLNWSKTKLSKKIAAGTKWATSFTWNKTAQETIKIYQQVLS